MMGQFGAGGGWGFGGIFMLLFWGLLILGVVAIVKWIFSGSGERRDASPGKTPLRILEERYARGEIDREEFEQRKNDLSS
jgi:putative membrane protein